MVAVRSSIGWLSGTQMIQATFEERLREATARALSFARELVIDTIPDEVRYDLRLIPHHDFGDVPPRVDPELQALWNRSSHGWVWNESFERVVKALWHDGRVPEWIDFGVHSVEGDITYLEVRFSRTLATDEALWYSEAGGIPPFKITSPEMPADFLKRLERHPPEAGESGSRWSLVPRKKKQAKIWGG